ncbi:MAG: PAS domain-containing protein [bacterium]|nr:PAS domain-containing protein [bacterium]
MDESSTESDPVSPLTLAQIAEQVFQGLPLGLIVFDHQLRILHRNEVAGELFADHRDVGRLLAEETLEGKCEDWPAVVRQVLDTGVQRRLEGVSCSGDTSAGEPRLLDLVCIPLQPEGSGPVSGGVLLCEDVTARASLERRLAVSERMAAVGRLAARVAHELNNPLDGALRYINMALRMLEPEGPEKATMFLTESRTGLLRMARIVGELLEFSRSNDAQFERANVNDIAEEALRTYQEAAAKQGVVLASAFHDQNMPMIRGAKLFQVCCNLVKNAIDAMVDGGTLTVTTGVVGGEVVLRFEDTGVGLPEENGDIFEAFFTTKPPGKGTGLGLAICRDYLARFNGTITAANRPEGGAVFVVRIPVDPRGQGQPEDPANMVTS